MAVELRAIGAGQNSFTVDDNPARTALARAVDHHGVEAHQISYFLFFRHLGDGLHHIDRTDRVNKVDFFLQQKFLENIGRQTPPDIRAVVGGDQQFIARDTHLGLQHQTLLGLGADNADHFVPELFIRPANGQDLRDPHAGRDAHDRADPFNFGGYTQRP